jgi:hypothetical protein
MADTSLWPIVVGGLIGVGGTLVGVVGTTIRDTVQLRHEKSRRRAEKFEELVAAVYEFDHWLDGIRLRDAFGDDKVPQTVSPFSKVQSISAVYFPQFNDLIRELDRASGQYRIWISEAAGKRLSDDVAQLSSGFEEAITPYVQKREALLDALKEFAREHLSNES